MAGLPVVSDDWHALEDAKMFMPDGLVVTPQLIQTSSDLFVDEEEQEKTLRFVIRAAQCYVLADPGTHAKANGLHSLATVSMNFLNLSVGYHAEVDIYGHGTPMRFKDLLGQSLNSEVPRPGDYPTQ